MSTLGWIILGGVGMVSIALVGGLAALLPEPVLDRILLPIVGMAAGSLLGGAFFHMLPSAVDTLGNRIAIYVWVVAGFVSFFVLEQALHWHHCHFNRDEHREPLGYLLLVADGLHNFIGGLAVGSAFIVDVRVGVVTWVAAAAHEVPQELGDFGVLVQGGWTKRSALLWNFVSALTFLIGGVIAYFAADVVDVAYLLPFAAGNFIYIAAADLVPELASQRAARDKVETTASLLVGLAILFAATWIS